MAQRRVVVTGLGCVSSVGNDVNTAWENVKNGKSGITKITLFDASAHQVQIAGEVKDFDINNYGVDRKLARKMSRMSKFLLGASIEAANDAGLSAENLKDEKAGIVTGVGIGLSDDLETAYKKYLEIRDSDKGIKREATKRKERYDIYNKYLKSGGREATTSLLQPSKAP